MAQQHIYTSASKLLDAGRSGFGTVARSKSLSPLLVSAIERVSQFANIRGTDRTRVIFVHRRITAANNRVHILSRIADAGADYTGRTNHIAHHLIVTQEEMTRAAAQGITPADVLMQFPWLERWDGAARFFGPEEDASLTQLIQPRGSRSSRATWAHTTGNPSHARLLSWEGAPRNGVLIVPRGVHPLGILAEALAEFGTQSWSRTFTTSLETTDEMSDLDWVISSPDTFHEIEGRCGARTRFDLTQPQSLPVPPEPAKVVEAPPTQLPELSPQPMSSPNIQTAVNPAARVELLIIQKSSGVRVTGSSQVKVAPVKKNHSKVLGIAAGLIGTLLILGLVYVILNQKKSSDDSANNSSTDSANVSKTTILTDNDKEDIKDKLKERGLNDKLADQFVVESANESATNPKELADYACKLIDFFRSRPSDIKSIRENIGIYFSKGHPDIASKRLEWISFLKEACVTADKCEDEVFDIEYVLDIHKNLKAAEKIFAKSETTPPFADEFCKLLIERELNEVFGSKPWNHDENKIQSLKNNLSKNYHKNNDYAYSKLTEFIRDDFKEFINSPLKHIFTSEQNDNNPYESNDVNVLSNALACWSDQNQKIQDNIKNNLGRGFIPKDFKELLTNHRSKSQGTSQDNTEVTATTNDTVKPPDKPSGPDLKDVKEREIIIVSAKNLKEGVKVGLLKKLFTTETKQLPSDLQIKADQIDISKIINSKLLNHNGEDFFGDVYNNPKYKINLNGQISILTESRTIEISFKKDNLNYQAFIVVDEKTADDKPIINDLKLEFREETPDQVTISGDLEKLLLASNLDDLNFDIPNPKGLSIIRSNEKWVIKLPPQPSDKKNDNIILSDKGIKNINAAKVAYGDAETKGRQGGPESEKNAAEEAVKIAKNKLLDQIHIALGEAKILKDFPNLGKEISLDNLDVAINKAEEVTGYKGLGAVKYDDKDKHKNDKGKFDEAAYEKHKQEVNKANIENVLIRYGEHHIEPLFKKYKIKDFKNENTESINKFIQILIKKPSSEAPPKSLAESISSIEVSTKSGRILFVAKK